MSSLCGRDIKLISGQLAIPTITERDGDPRPTTTSFDFEGKGLGVKFRIEVAETNVNEWTAVLSKVPRKPTKAVIKISFNGCLDVVREFCAWTDACKISTYVPPTLAREAIIMKYEIFWQGLAEVLPMISLHHHMQSFLGTPKFSDVVICIDDVEIPAHKVILAAQSRVLSTMLEENMEGFNGDRIIIKDIQVDVMKRVIEFLYTGTIDSEKNVDVIFEILIVADKYEIWDLRRLCITAICDKVNVNNVLHILEKSNLYNIEEISERSIDCMVIRKTEVLQLEDLENWICRNPQLFFKFSRHLGKRSSLFLQRSSFF